MNGANNLVPEKRILKPLEPMKGPRPIQGCTASEEEEEEKL
jgi:hypothetical protein